MHHIHGKPACQTTVGTKSIADPEKSFQESISEKLLILLLDRPCLEVIIVSSNVLAFLFLQDNYWNQSESYSFSKKVLKCTGPALSRVNSVMLSARQYCLWPKLVSVGLRAEWTGENGSCGLV